MPSTWLNIADTGPGGPFTDHVTGLTSGANPLFTPGPSGGIVLNLPIPGQSGLEEFNSAGQPLGLTNQSVTNAYQQVQDNIHYLEDQAADDATNNTLAEQLDLSVANQDAEVAQSPLAGQSQGSNIPAFSSLGQVMSFFGLSGTQQAAGSPAAQTTPAASTASNLWVWLVLGGIVFVLFLLFRR